jgi:hypothetical protein
VAASVQHAAIGISAHLGWAAATTVALEGAELRVLRSDRLEISKPDDRAAREPYHIAGGFDGLERVPRPPDPERVLRRGLERQRRAAARAIAALAADLETLGYRLACSGLLVSRGRAAASVEQALASHTQIHIEEGIASRESFRLALTQQGARSVALDQKNLWSTASAALGRSEAALLSELRSKRPENQGAWRKEEQSAALAAWLAWIESFPEV